MTSRLAWMGLSLALGAAMILGSWTGSSRAQEPLAATDLRIGSITVCTMLATAAGCLSSILYMWAVFGKPDPTMGCNGLLAGAVAITAPCAFVNPLGAVVIGACAGILVIWAVLFVERVLKVDDPVGAVAVHGVNGAFGCLCIGLFATGEYGAGWNSVANLAPRGLFYGGGGAQLAAEAIGVLANFCWVFPMALLFFFIVEKTMGNRTTAKTEIDGLDIHEMGLAGYVHEDVRAVEPRRAGAPGDLRPGRAHRQEGRRSRPARPRRPPLIVRRRGGGRISHPLPAAPRNPEVARPPPHQGGGRSLDPPEVAR